MKPAEPEGDQLEGIFRECGRDLGAYFSRRHGGREAANDLVQETFLQMARRLKAGQVMSSPRTYLFGIARNVSLAFFRKQANAPQALDELGVETAVNEPDARIELAREVIAALPALQREILDLRFEHGLSYAEIARALEIPIGTVRSRLHHALALLRARLEQDNQDGPPSDPSPKPNPLSPYEN